MKMCNHVLQLVIFPFKWAKVVSHFILLTSYFVELTSDWFNMELNGKTYEIHVRVVVCERKLTLKCSITTAIFIQPSSDK